MCRPAGIGRPSAWPELTICSGSGLRARCQSAYTTATNDLPSSSNGLFRCQPVLSPAMDIRAACQSQFQIRNTRHAEQPFSRRACPCCEFSQSRGNRTAARHVLDHFVGCLDVNRTERAGGWFLEINPIGAADQRHRGFRGVAHAHQQFRSHGGPDTLRLAPSVDAMSDSLTFGLHFRHVHRDAKPRAVDG